MRELLSRRGFLRAGAGLTLAGAVTALGGQAAWAEACDAAMGTVPVSQRSIQLYTMTPLMDVDPGLVLQQLYGIGYRRAEHAGFGSAASAAEFRKLCDDAGPQKIACSSGHQGIAFPFDQAGFAKTLADAVAVGQRFIISPSTPASSQADWKAYAKALNTAGGLARAAGLVAVGHHNHTGEYTPFSGTSLRPIDILMAECDPEVTVMEMDLCWVWSAGVDPVDVLHQYPHRFRQFHVKDMNQVGQPTYPGLGVIDFDRIFAAAAATQTIEEYIVEQDQSLQPLLTAQQGWDLLAAARFACPTAQAVARPAPAAAPAADEGRLGFGFVPTPDGAKVQLVVAGSPAERAGLRVGQLIEAVNGAPLKGLAAPEMIKAVLARTPAVFLSIAGAGDVKVTRRLSPSAG
jgi:sugar phosphate isomerase/epimerase